MNPFAAAGLAGLLATVPMTGAMLIVQRTQRRPRSPLPPREITRNSLKQTGVARNPHGKGLEAVTWISHFAYGAAAGAGYPLMHHHLRLPAGLQGSAYGLGIWAISYLGWLPAAGILRPPTRQTPNRNAALIVSHLVWGIATKAIFDRLRSIASLR